jgi:hypothetical protein
LVRQARRHLEHHAAQRLEITTVDGQRCYLACSRTPYTSSCNESSLAPPDHRTHIAGTRTFHRRQHRHGIPLTFSTDHFSGCGASTINLRRRSQLSPPAFPPTSLGPSPSPSSSPGPSPGLSPKSSLALALALAPAPAPAPAPAVAIAIALALPQPQPLPQP